VRRMSERSRDTRIFLLSVGVAGAALLAYWALKRSRLQAVQNIAALQTNPALQALGYGFDSQLVLRCLETGESFKFKNQSHYDLVAAALAEFVQEKLQSDFGLLKVFLPLDGDLKEEKQIPIYASPSLDADVLFVLIQGSGKVRPGQWSRALCINQNLHVGTIFPYLREIYKRRGSVLVLNPNQAHNALKEHVDCCATPETHTLYVYDKLIRPCRAKKIVIIAHSYGGCCTFHLLQKRAHESELTDRLAAIAFTDSVHNVISPD